MKLATRTAKPSDDTKRFKNGLPACDRPAGSLQSRFFGHASPRKSRVSEAEWVTQSPNGNVCGSLSGSGSTSSGSTACESSNQTHSSNCLGSAAWK
jgi:hypothetical protein